MNKRYEKYFTAAIVSLPTFIVYLSSLRHGFVGWDDPGYVHDNLHIRSLNSAFFRWAFTNFDQRTWHPLTWISHAMDYALWGLNPLGHHLTNIIIHTMNTFVVVLLGSRLLEVWKEKLDQESAHPFSPPGRGLHRSVNDGSGAFLHGRGAMIAAGVTGLLFGLHPLHVESVAWVSGRKDLLSTLFFLLCLLSYLKYWSHKSYKTYFLSLVFFTLTLLSKSMAVTLPVILLIFDWYPLKRWRSLKPPAALLWEKLPFILLALVTSVMTVWANSSGFAASVPLAVRLLVAVRSLLLYLWKMFLPLKLLPHYPYPEKVSLLSSEYMLLVLILAGITAGCIVAAKKEKLWLAVWGCYITLLLPVLGIIQISVHSMADRYTYLPGLAPFFLFGTGVVWVWTEAGTGKRKWPAVKPVIGLLAAALLLVMVSLTLRQISYWKDSISLWGHYIEKDPGHFPLAYYNRGTALMERGEYERAVADFDMMLSLEPHVDGYTGRGLAFRDKGEYARALEDFTRAISLKPGEAYVYYNRATAYGRMGLFGPAIADFNKAIELNPAAAENYIGRGLVHERAGQFARALADLDKGIELNPLSGDAYLNRGVTFERMGQFERAVFDYSKAVSLNSSDDLAYSNRAALYGRMGQTDKAIGDYSKVLSLKPDSDSAYLERGELHIRTGGKASALWDFRRSCDLGSEAGCEALRRHQGQ